MMRACQTAGVTAPSANPRSPALRSHGENREPVVDRAVLGTVQVAEIGVVLSGRERGAGGDESLTRPNRADQVDGRVWSDDDFRPLSRAVDRCRARLHGPTRTED